MNHFNSKNITVVLGPTNTGKTHLAIERMTGYASGIIGFPLRLLARENYDRLVSKIGADKVALVTGEERIIPSDARYFCCTVESMPVKNNIDVCSTKTQFDFIAIDEIQLTGDYERVTYLPRIMRHAVSSKQCSWDLRQHYRYFELSFLTHVLNSGVVCQNLSILGRGSLLA